ncbi:hypothetical protein DBR06_SOUSAS22410055, partial [Sousa chinensis]
MQDGLAQSAAQRVSQGTWPWLRSAAGPHSSHLRRRKGLKCKLYFLGIRTVNTEEQKKERKQRHLLQ